jgi:Putative bacterial sensory transduction regulator
MLHAFKPLAISALLLIPVGASVDQDIVREIGNDRLEGILRRLNLDFTKARSSEMETAYDYKIKGDTFTLTSLRGKEIRIEVSLPGGDLKAVNEWNTKSKVSKARQAKDNVVLSAYLDLAGGVTEETVTNLISKFNQETAAWSRVAVAVVTNEETFKKIAPEQIEKILKEMKIDAKKSVGKNPNVVAFDFKISRNDLGLRLTTFGGEDLMIDCTYPTAPLAKVNEWNIKRSFVRAVYYANPNGNPYIALEANLDCLPGVAESTIRYFIASFDTESVEFERFLKGS